MKRKIDIKKALTEIGEDFAERHRPLEIDLTCDECFKYLIRDKKILNPFAKEAIRLFFNHGVQSVSELLNTEFQVKFEKRKFRMDALCRAGEILLGVEMQKGEFVIQRFFLHWCVISSEISAGVKTRDLTTPKALQVILLKDIRRRGRNTPNFQDDWAVCWDTVPRSAHSKQILGESNPFALNILELDLDKFQESGKTPDGFLEKFLKLLCTRSITDLIQMASDPEYAILEDVFRRVIAFFDKEDKENYMGSHYQDVLAAKLTGFDEGHAKGLAEGRAESAKEMQAKDEAIKAEKARADKAEAGLAQAKADFDAKLIQFQTDSDAKLAQVRADFDSRMAELLARIEAMPRA